MQMTALQRKFIMHIMPEQLIQGKEGLAEEEIIVLFQ